MKTILVIFIFLIGCGHQIWHDPKKPENTIVKKSDLEKVLAKADLYKSIQHQATDGQGFIASPRARCDALLHTGLLCASGVPADIDAAMGEPGQWFRTPGHDCYPDHAASTISRDMVVGLLWCAWRAKRNDISDGIISYADSHAGIMGEGPVSRVWLTPQLRDTAEGVSLRIRGQNWSPGPAFFPSGLSGFRSHIQTLHVLLRGELLGRVTSCELDRIREHSARADRNPLYQYARARYITGDYAPVWRLLADDSLWPQDRLPSSDDRCEENLNQRDWGPDWMPCPNRRELYSGVDLLFVVGLMNGK